MFRWFAQQPELRPRASPGSALGRSQGGAQTNKELPWVYSKCRRLLRSTRTHATAWRDGKSCRSLGSDLDRLSKDEERRIAEGRVTETRQRGKTRLAATRQSLQNSTIQFLSSPGGELTSRFPSFFFTPSPANTVLRAFAHCASRVRSAWSWI